jgi:gliding motility-associated-like protein
MLKMLKYIHFCLFLVALQPVNAQIIEVRNVCVGTVVEVKTADFTCPSTAIVPIIAGNTADVPLFRYDSVKRSTSIQLNKVGTCFCSLPCSNTNTQKIQINFVDCDAAPCLGPNIVPNPSFEALDNCAQQRTSLTNIVSNWLDYPLSVLGTGSCDLYHSLCRYADVPSNSFSKFIDANNRPRTGNGMAGFYQLFPQALNSSIVYNSEFLGVRLKQPLIVGRKYKLRFYTKFAKTAFPNALFDKIGAGFSIGDPNRLFQNNRYEGSEAMVFNPVGQLISDTTFWTKIEGIFTADQPYTEMLVGNLSRLNTLPINKTSYYVFDDFSLQIVEDIYAITRVDTVVCKGQSVSLNIKTNATTSLKNVATAQITPLNTQQPITFPNVTQTACYQLRFEAGGCLDSLNFCVRNHPNYDTLVTRLSCLPSDTGLIVRRLNTSKGCDSVVSIKTTLIAPTLVNLGNDTVADIGSRLTLTPTLSGDSAKTLLWQPKLGLSCTNCLNPDVVLPQTMVYSLTVTNRGGCKSKAEKRITALDKPLVFVPNTFSPNGDNVNETLVVYANPNRVDLIKRFSVFDRWGNMVFNKTNFLPNDETAAWDGLFSGRKISPDVFLYVVECVLFDKQIKTISGDVTLIH